MRKDAEKYESLIRNSPLFQIDRDAEASRYKSEALKLTEYLYCYLLEINESKYIEFGAEIMDTANSCIKSFKPDCGDFLNYFNVAMSKAYKKAFAKQKEAEVRKGITVSEDDQRAIQKILKLAEYKNMMIDLNTHIHIFHVTKVNSLMNKEVDIIFGEAEDGGFIMKVKDDKSEFYVNIEDVEYVKIVDRGTIEIAYMLNSKNKKMTILINELIQDQFVQVYNDFFAKNMRKNNHLPY